LRLENLSYRLNAALCIRTLVSTYKVSLHIRKLIKNLFYSIIIHFPVFTDLYGKRKFLFFSYRDHSCFCNWRYVGIMQSKLSSYHIIYHVICTHNDSLLFYIMLTARLTASPAILNQIVKLWLADILLLLVHYASTGTRSRFLLYHRVRNIPNGRCNF